MIFDREKELRKKKLQVINLLELNSEDAAQAIIGAMTDDEFILLNTQANDMYERRKNDAAEFGREVVKLMTAHVEKDGTMLAPLEFIRLAEGVKGSLVMNGYDGDYEAMMASAQHMEFYRCILDIVQPGESKDKSIKIPPHLS